MCLETASVPHKSVTCPNAQSQFQRHCSAGDTARCQRHFASSPSLVQRADQQVNDLTQAPCPDDTQRCQRHPVSEDTQRCQRHRTPSGSGPVVLVPSLARSCLAVGWRLFVCGGGCRPFGVSVARVALLGAFPAAFSSFWRFPVSPRLLSGSSFLCRK